MKKIMIITILATSCLLSLGSLRAEYEAEMHSAADNKQWDDVKKYLGQGATIDEPDDEGYTVLHKAVLEGRLDIVQDLLNKGATTKTSGMYGNSPLHDAAGELGRLDIVKALIEQGNADIHAKDDKGKTPLHNAASAGHPDVVQYLTSKGANIDEKDRRYQKSAKEYIQESLEYALSENQTKELLKFNKFDSSKYSWEYMLNLAQEKNISAPVKFLMIQMNLNAQDLMYITDSKKESSGKNAMLLNAVRKIFNDAKTNKKNAFGKAVIDYYLELRKLAGMGKLEGKNIPEETILLINQFKEI